MPKVSIIIPVYNTEKYLERCLESITNQTLSDVEIICINDYSTDNSLNILNKFADNDNRIKIINFDKNQGASVARNKGIEIAQGEYIGFVDSDDFIDLDFYEKLYNKAKETSADISKADIRMFNNETKDSKIEDWISINDLIKINKAYFTISFTSAIFSRQLIMDSKIRFPEGYSFFEDPCFTIQIVFYANKIEFVRSSNYYYCNNCNSETRKILNINHVQSTYNISKILLPFINNNKINKEYYTIIFDFIVRQILIWCNLPNSTTEMSNVASENLVYAFKNCAYPKECTFYHFAHEKKMATRKMIQNLRAKIKC